MTLTKDAWAGQIGGALAAGADFRRTLAHIAGTPLEGEPNFDGPLCPADARRFIRMAREILAAHPG